MNLILTCNCGHKFRVTLERDGQEVACPGCGIVKKIKAPVTPAPAAPRPEPEEDEVKLKDLHTAPPMVKEAFEENDGSSFALDENDGRADLHTGPGMYGTVAIIKLDGVAHQIAFGTGGKFALAEQREEILIVDMQRHRAIEAYTGHEAEVTAVALSATEPLALSGDDDGELQLWEVATLKRLKKLRAHKDTINAVALSPDGKYALTGGTDGKVRLWNLSSGERVSLEHADWADYDQEISYVAFSRDGAKFVAGGSGGRTSLWETETGDRIKRFPGLELPISCVRVSDEGGQILATTQPIEHRGMSYLIIAHWDAKTGKPINQFNIAVESVPCSIAPDRGGKRVIISGCSDAPWMGIWSLQDGRCLYAFEHFRGTPLSLAVSPHNNRLLAALDTARLQVFGLETS